jgi:hypothetical protein
VMRCKCKAGWGGGVWLKEFWIVWRNGRGGRRFRSKDPKIYCWSVVDSFVYHASGLSVVASMSYYRDEAGWLTKAIPSLKTNEDALLGDHWSIVESITSCHKLSGWCGWQVFFGVGRHRITSCAFGKQSSQLQLPTSMQCNPTAS